MKVSDGAINSLKLMSKNKLVKENFKAIEWYAHTYDLVPQLSTVKDVMFKQRQTGEHVTIELSELMILYHNYVEEMKGRKGNG